MVWPCPLAVDAYVAAGRDLDFPRPAGPPLPKASTVIGVTAHCGRDRLLEAGSPTCFDSDWIHAPQAPRDCVVERRGDRPSVRPLGIVERVTAQVLDDPLTRRAERAGRRHHVTGAR